MRILLTICGFHLQFADSTYNLRIPLTVAASTAAQFHYTNVLLFVSGFVPVLDSANTVADSANSPVFGAMLSCTVSLLVICLWNSKQLRRSKKSSKVRIPRQICYNAQNVWPNDKSNKFKNVISKFRQLKNFESVCRHNICYSRFPSSAIFFHSTISTMLVLFQLENLQTWPQICCRKKSEIKLLIYKLQVKARICFVTFWLRKYWMLSLITVDTNLSTYLSCS